MCGVSTATVSNVIHGKTKKVSPAVRARIEEVIRHSGYVPNQSALMLSQTWSDLIGVVVGTKAGTCSALEDPYFASLFAALELEIRKNGKYMMSIVARTPEEILRQAARWNLDGMIICNFGKADMIRITESFVKPVATIDVDYQMDYPKIVQVHTDDERGGYLAAKHLIEKGHRRIAMVADNDAGVDHMRWEGMQQAMHEHGIPVEESSHLLLQAGVQPLTNEFERLLPVLLEKTGLFFASDYYALQAAMFFSAHGIAVPGQISVIGFDDLLFASLCQPLLTTIHQDIPLKAGYAVKAILSMLAGEQVEHQIAVPVSLVERESVAERLCG